MHYQATGKMALGDRSACRHWPNDLVRPELPSKGNQPMRLTVLKGRRADATCVAATPETIKKHAGAGMGASLARAKCKAVAGVVSSSRMSIQEMIQWL